MGPETFERLGAASTATLQNQLFIRGLRRTVVQGVLPLGHGRRNFVAEAFTLRYIPAREDLDTVESFRDPEHAQRAAIDTIPAGQALVVDSRGDGAAASAGEILMTRLAVRGCAAFVTDGSVRDSHHISEMDMPVFVGSVTPTTNLVLHHAVDFQVPIACGGVAVFPGDVLVGDPEGVVVIPRHLAEEVSRDAVDQEGLEEFLLERVRGGAPVRGTYPPTAELRAEYDAQRGARG